MMSQTSAVDHKDSVSDTGGNISPANEHAAGPTLGAVCNTGQEVSSAGSVNAADSVPHGANEFPKESPAIPHDAKEKFSGLGNPAHHSTTGSANDSSVNGNGESHAVDGAPVTITENGANVIGSAALHQTPLGSGLSPEEERLWGMVTVNSLDFIAWTALIEETERAQEGNILKIRKVYDAFLAEFPLCYGYWKKYADHEAHLSSVDKVAEVYEQAVQGVTYSVDMWVHYCAFAIGAYGDPDTIRRLFERALDYVGTDYLCFPLWDKYIEYEISQEDWPCVATIYTRVLEIPNQQLDHYFEGFKELVANRPLSELRTAEEVAAADSEGAGRENEGELHPNAVNPSLKDAEELEKYIAIREYIYKKAKDFDAKIIGFESAIRRPYFHVRPLNGAELEIWHDYLDFIEAEGDFNKVVKLYERCLIACANYPEYWIRYILRMETIDSMDLAKNALVRATQVFVKRQPEIHLFAAQFKEQHDDISGARAAYQLVHTEISPGHLEAVIKHANMEQRLGKLQAACSLYEQAIAIERGKEQSQTLSLLFARYSRFMLLVSGNVEKAREILAQGVESAQLSKSLLEAMIHFESIQTFPKQTEYLDSLVEKFIISNPESSSDGSVDEREEVSSIFLEFLNLFGDVQSIKKADDRHAKLFLRHKSTVASKKRHADLYLASDSTKVTKSIGSASTPSVMGVYPGTQNQWAAGYGVQPQTWPQASQPQAQQWGPGYAQQAAYGAYGYGACYSHPQAPTSVPQNATYGTYPPTYPTQQAFPQQTYAQPATATALNLAQQVPTAAAPPATYYTNYY